jgi:hypothetical protein
MVVGHQYSRHAALLLPGGAPHAPIFSHFFLLNPRCSPLSTIKASAFFFVQYFHLAVQEEFFISIKFDNVIKVLVRIGYRNISL